MIPRNRIDGIPRSAPPEEVRRLLDGVGDGAGMFHLMAELLYLEALPRQVEPDLSERINRISTAIERDFSTFRPVIGGARRTFLARRGPTPRAVKLT